MRLLPTCGTMQHCSDWHLQLVLWPRAVTCCSGAVVAKQNALFNLQGTSCGSGSASDDTAQEGMMFGSRQAPSKLCLPSPCLLDLSDLRCCRVKFISAHAYTLGAMWSPSSNKMRWDMQKFLGSHWPEELGEAWKQQSLDFQAKTHEVALKILRAMALALCRDEYEFVEVTCSLSCSAAFVPSTDHVLVDLQPFDIESEENPRYTSNQHLCLHPLSSLP